MADTTDRLTTVIEMLGAEQSARQLLGVGAAAGTASRSLVTLIERVQIMPGLFTRMNVTAGLAAGGLAGIATAGLIAVSVFRQIEGTVSEAMRAWDQYNNAL